MYSGSSLQQSQLRVWYVGYVCMNGQTSMVHPTVYPEDMLVVW